MLNETLRNSSVSDPHMRKSADSPGMCFIMVFGVIICGLIIFFEDSVYGYLIPQMWFIVVVGAIFCHRIT